MVRAPGIGNHRTVRRYAWGMAVTTTPADSVPPLLEAFGRLHPVMVHLPLGLVFAAFAVEAWRVVQRRREMSPFTPTALGLAALTGVMAGATGIAFAESHGGGDDLFWHRWLGIGATVACAGARESPSTTRAPTIRRRTILRSVPTGRGASPSRT